MRAATVVALIFCLGFFAGWNATRSQAAVKPPAPVACPEPPPSTEPERCMAFWFGPEYTATHDKENLRLRVCGHNNSKVTR